uniref:Uncharacterized protein n=1 Tax=Salix viminalis TaxID=40686 RepID=A0A6N2N1H2_SALVM
MATIITCLMFEKNGHRKTGTDTCFLDLFTMAPWPIGFEDGCASKVKEIEELFGAKATPVDITNRF